MRDMGLVLGRRDAPIRWLVLLGACTGSIAGLVFGLGSLNRPLLNGLLFYALGAALGAVLGAGVAVVGLGLSAARRRTRRAVLGRRR